MARCMEIQRLRLNHSTDSPSFHICELELGHCGVHICWCEMSFGQARSWSRNDVVPSEMTPERARELEEGRRPDRRRDPAEDFPAPHRRPE
jgi:hypothetical protein